MPTGAIALTNDSDAQVIAMWLHGRSRHTQRAYAADAAAFLTRAGKPLQSVTLLDLQEFDGSLGHLSPASRYRTLSAVKSLLAFGHRIGYLAFDVGRVLRVPAGRDHLAERILSEADVRRMLDLEPDSRNRAILALLYASGIRVSELSGLRWRNLQPSGASGQVTVLGKGSKTRSIPLPLPIWRQLASIRGDAEPGEPVFPSRKKGEPLAAQGVLAVVRKAARRAGIQGNVSPHWLRHAHASHALDRGAPIHLVQATLGHASITTTGRYLHARPTDSSSRFLGFE